MKRKLSRDISGKTFVNERNFRENALLGGQFCFDKKETVAEYFGKNARK